MEIRGPVYKVVGAAPDYGKPVGVRRDTASNSMHPAMDKWLDHLQMRGSGFYSMQLNRDIKHTVGSRKRPASETTLTGGGKRLRPMSRKEYLDDMLSNITLDKADKQASKRLVDETLKTVMRFVTAQRDGGWIYSQQYVNAGSYPVKTKIGKADEFDVNIPLNIDWRALRLTGSVKYDFENTANTQNLHNRKYLYHVPEGELIPPGYAVVEVGIERYYIPGWRFRPLSGSRNVPEKFLNQIIERPVKNSYLGMFSPSIERHMLRSVQALIGFGSHKTTTNSSSTSPWCIELIPWDVKKDLFERMNLRQYLLFNKGVYISPVSHGPALTMTFVANGRLGIKHHISVDVTVSLHCDIPLTEFGWPRENTKKAFSSQHINEVIKAGTHLVPKKDLFWAISFSKAEKALLKCLDRDQGCRKYVTKLLKKFVQTCTSQSTDGLPGISSHIIKTQVLWSCEEHSHDPNYWHRDNRDNCLTNTMRELEDTLRSEMQPEYFNPALNILEGKRVAVLNKLAQFMHNKRIDLYTMK